MTFWLGRVIARQGLKPLERVLSTGDPHATADRLFRSRHVKDLQLILALALWSVLLVLIVGFPLTIESEAVGQWSMLAKHRSIWVFVHMFFAASGQFLSFFAPVLAVFGAVLAWAYQAGSARLGVVDLFACEISTLCRVASVLDTVRRRVDEFDDGPPQAPSHHGDGERTGPPHPFTSQESYFPVFDGNSHDLQSLEARVVINITAFYTYMKAVRDSLRTLAAIPPTPGETPQDRAWRDASRNVIYMLFLAMESARHAIGDLVEFEPEGAERTIVILISELEAYRFLRGQFTDDDDVHSQRIAMRASEYQRVVPPLHRAVDAGMATDRAAAAGTDPRLPKPASQWEPAWLLLPELDRRFVAAMGSARS